ncbi:fumarylacetoacetate hydrolase family protein [Aestuariirhabdus litorea]|uniref:FAA hydrolase family protein n=1 Tax=Aestuariirhabdus litorea TaxID=2528527 RepID=A0A3P3VSW8_9GAMM|nr:fumarylacetoacetate hydrolase family protein [Aestuariirhabdus litorea]RRJ85078.1 FAA hydrolase family protein [Aestuariirhabdus litorea]RWW98303.1 FAA hydrolase family protein [Endozoicomonadaceae bacterium GTF-13]
MKLINFINRSSQQQGVGLVVGERILDLASALPSLPRNMRGLLEQLEQWRPQLEALAAGDHQEHLISYDQIRLLPVVDNPEKVICIGRNYADHAKESGGEVLEYPEIFLRTAGSLIAHGEDIVRPACSDKLDYEVEVAIIIGKKIRHATPDNALDAIAGYCIFNDASIRDYQMKTPQWCIGKNFDSTGALGPYLVTADELPRGLKGARLQTRLNGELVQDSNIDHLCFDMERLVIILSECMTLKPGDVIATGTPAGVGFSFRPPKWMKHGDVVSLQVEGLGTLENGVVDEAR